MTIKNLIYSFYKNDWVVIFGVYYILQCLLAIFLIVTSIIFVSLLRELDPGLLVVFVFYFFGGWFVGQAFVYMAHDKLMLSPKVNVAKEKYFKFKKFLFIWSLLSFVVFYIVGTLFEPIIEKF